MLSITPDHAVAVESPATLALVLDTLNHPGMVADRPASTPRTRGQLGTPYITADKQLEAIGHIYTDAFTRTLLRDNVPAEPALWCYVYTAAARPVGCA
jgi:hypothetical protein